MNDLSGCDGDGAALLGPGDPPVFEIVNAAAATPVQLVCDHASRAVPAQLGRLGLDADQFDRHIAYDIGAAGVTRHLAAALDAPAVLAGYSRLVIDVNRPPGDPESIPEISDGTGIPGNRNLDDAARRRRVTALFEPYHDAIRETIAELRRRGQAPALLSVHSFTPRLGNTARPWDAGVLWNRDPRLARPLIEKLAARGLRVGDNLPYSGRRRAYTIDLHGAAAGLANVVVEINQGLIADRPGIERWAGILAEAMGEILKMPGLHRVQRY